MTHHAITTAAAPAPVGPYSQAIVANGFIFTAGLGPQNPTTGEAPNGIEAQTAQLMQNLSAVLDTHEADLSGVVKVTAHLEDPDRDFDGFNKIYRRFVSDPLPARTTVGSHLAGILVEIDVIALVTE